MLLLCKSRSVEGGVTAADIFAKLGDIKGESLNSRTTSALNFTTTALKIK